MRPALQPGDRSNADRPSLVPVDAPDVIIEAVLAAIDRGDWPPGTESWAEPLPESAAECDGGPQ